VVASQPRGRPLTTNPRPCGWPRTATRRIPPASSGDRSKWWPIWRP
jgi:hypothetical protein